MGEFNNKEFKRLLKLGIGTRSQKEFAEKTGIAAPTINKMLNNNDIPKPKKSTLEVFANNMAKVTLKELMEACGYDYIGIDESVRNFESLICNNLHEIIDKREILENYNSLTSIINSFSENILNIKIENSEIAGDNIEESFKVSLIWRYDYYVCTTTFLIGCLITRSDKYILVQSDLNPDTLYVESFTKYKEIEYRTEEIKSKERLIKQIFGEVFGEKIQTTYVGFGFYIDNEELLPEGFMNFINNHSKTLCYKKENSKIYQKALEKDADIFEVFNEFVDRNGDVGPYAAIAEIIDIETKDIREDKTNSFAYYEKEDYYEDNIQKPCIMCRYANDKVTKQNKKLIKYFYNCIKELKLTSFGVIYYPTAIIKEDISYNVDEMYYPLA